MHLKAPFTWFGGKSKIAGKVWDLLGDCPNYIEPFFGSGAVLLLRPEWHKGRIETVNDADGLVANFWRALQNDPEEMARVVDWPANENDLHARHAWLVENIDDLVPQLEGDPAYYDVKIAAWWCWGLALWIGGEFCSGKGPWRRVDGRLVKCGTGDSGQGVQRKRIHLGDDGKGVQRRRIHIGNSGKGVRRKRINLTHAGKGVQQSKRFIARKGAFTDDQFALLKNPTDTQCVKVKGELQDAWRVLLDLSGRGGRLNEGLWQWFNRLAERLALVRVCCGDWSRVCGQTPTIHNGLTGVFLDPPYSGDAGRDNGLYRKEDLDVAHRVREWCLHNGSNKQLRIVLCGYEGEHGSLEDAGWDVVEWNAQGGYSDKGNNNRFRERLWASPHCLREPTLFDGVPDNG